MPLEAKCRSLLAGTGKWGGTDEDGADGLWPGS